MSNRVAALGPVIAAACLVCGSFPADAQTAGSGQGNAPPPSEREALLLQRIEKLEARIAALEASVQASGKPAQPVTTRSPATVAASGARGDTTSQDSPSLPGFLAGTTLNFNLDGYYSYNFNQPGGRVNLLRAYDVLSNSFSLNQAGFVIERATDPAQGRRVGLRLDFMFGQATETLQGGPQNEPRPQVYRNIFQAYGTYVAPVGSGLTVDFGKWGSSLGYEGNYTKDQINYSRSYYFNFLPFYHFGFRTAYNFTSRLAAQYWLVNGANQSEDFNGFKSQNFQLVLKPAKSITWTFNYYTGREHRDLVPSLNPGIPILPTQPGLSTTLAEPQPRGRTSIFDSYAAWSVSDKLLLVAEGDFVDSRLQTNSPRSHAGGGAGYVKYQFTRPFSLGGRFEYLGDAGGLFSGASQALKEATLTGTWQWVDGFQVRGEIRRDFSNQAYYLASRPGELKHEQTTALLGLIWWFGGREGAW